MTPGPYLHIGGDEVKKMTPEQYASFMERAQAIVQKHGKTVIAWDEIIHAKLLPTTVVQYWRPDASLAPPPGTKLILSPANRIYLDMKYDANAVLGQDWAGNVDVNVPYDWDPGDAPEGAGVLDPGRRDRDLVRDAGQHPRPGVHGCSRDCRPWRSSRWTAQSSRDWNDFNVRLGGQARRWSALGINAYWSPKIDWQR